VGWATLPRNSVGGQTCPATVRGAPKKFTFTGMIADATRPVKACVCGAGGIPLGKLGVNPECFAARSGAAYASPLRLLWSRRDSNPRPNDRTTCFPHASSFIGFRRPAGEGHPTGSLGLVVLPPLQAKASASIPG